MKKTDKIITNNLNDQIAQLFSALKMPAANQTFQNQQKSPDYVDMPFSVRLHHILRAEVTAREEKRMSRLYKESGINDALPSLDRLTYDKSRGLKRELIDELATGEYLRQGLNVIVTGMAGTGKTWLIKSLAKAALAQSVKVLYIRAPQLIERFRQARKEGEPAQYRNRINAKQLVVIDDFGMSPIDAEVQDDLLSLLDDRRDDGTSLIIASQRPLSDWYAYLGGDMHADAILDRLKNSSYIIGLRGRSLRESTAVARKLKTVNKKETDD